MKDDMKRNKSQEKSGLCTGDIGLYSLQNQCSLNALYMLPVEFKMYFLGDANEYF